MENKIKIVRFNKYLEIYKGMTKDEKPELIPAEEWEKHCFV